MFGFLGCHNICYLPNALAALDRPRYSPRRFGYLLFLVEIRNICIRQTGSGINPHHCSYGNVFNVKYLKNGDGYDVGLKGSQI